MNLKNGNTDEGLPFFFMSRLYENLGLKIVMIVEWKSKNVQVQKNGYLAF